MTPPRRASRRRAALALTLALALGAAPPALAQTDTAPSFDATGFSNVYVTNVTGGGLAYMPADEAIVPFQIPAATGGNGAITYTAATNPMPPGLKFDATGTDAGGCTASDLPVGTAATWATAPRTICGTPTGTGSTLVRVQAHDGDSNRASSDAASLSFTIFIASASVASSTPSSLTEHALDTATVNVALRNATFSSSVTTASFELVTAIPNVSIASVATSTSTTLTLAFSGNFDTVETLAVTVLEPAYSGSA